MTAPTRLATPNCQMPPEASPENRLEERTHCTWAGHSGEKKNSVAHTRGRSAENVCENDVVTAHTAIADREKRIAKPTPVISTSQPP